MIDVIKVIILLVFLVFPFIFCCSESEQQKDTREFSKRYLEKNLKKDIDK